MNNDKEFKETLQSAALGWLSRHGAEFLANDQLMFGGAVYYVMNTFNCSRPSAENAVTLAYGDFRSGTTRQYLDRALSSEKIAAIRDPDSGLVYTVPVVLIWQMIQRSPEQRNLLQLVQNQRQHFHS